MKKAVVAYILKKPFLDKPEGEVVHMEEADAQALVDAGILEEASHEDVHGGDEGDGDEMEAPVDAAMTRAVNRISKDLEKSIVRATEGAVSRLAKPSLSMPSVV